jgi:hypothetical protein
MDYRIETKAYITIVTIEGDVLKFCAKVGLSRKKRLVYASMTTEPLIEFSGESIGNIEITTNRQQ